MPILSNVGRRSPGQLFARIAIYLLLTVGALGVVYPMLLVFGQSLSDDYDLRDNAIIPYYLFDRNELNLKYIFSFTKKLELLASRHNRNEWTSQSAMRGDEAFYRTRPSAFAAQGLPMEAHSSIIKDLLDFKKTLNPDDLLAMEFRVEDYFRPFLREHYGRLADKFLAAFQESGRMPDWFLKTYPEKREQQRVLADRDRLGTAIMNNDLRADYLNYYALEVPKPGNFTVPVWRPREDNKTRLWREFMQFLPPERKLIISSDSYWHDFLQKQYPSIQLLNEAWGAHHKGFYELKVPLEPPAGGQILADWKVFIVKRWPRRLLQVPPEFAPQWRAFVQSRFLARVEEKSGRPATPEQALAELNRVLGRSLEQWSQLEFPLERPQGELLSRYWCEFTFSGAIPAEKMILDAPELNFRRFLLQRYTVDGTAASAVSQLNKAWHTTFQALEEVPLPLAYADCIPPRFESRSLRWSFAIESFKRVLEYILGKGYAAQNTLILVILTLAAALTINPMAAYSLSRFSMKHSHRILIFFLATMAFPAEVAMIPNFLLMRDLHLLNSYAALILPGMANGFSIFLLKCFFDSLPRELYEAAELDGARELQIFRLVALPMLTPILAYIGLATFVAAYSGFMWAFVICPDQRMWTLMVWVYDFQTRNPGNNYVMAATLLVSLPPLIVFLFANNVIMKGIMIPSMK